MDKTYRWIYHYISCDMWDRIAVGKAFFFTHIAYVWCSIFLFCRWYLRLNQNIPQNYWNTGENCGKLCCGEEILPCTLRNADSSWCSYLCYSYLNTNVSWQWFWGQLLPIMFQSLCSQYKHHFLYFKGKYFKCKKKVLTLPTFLQVHKDCGCQVNPGPELW